jgi:hypothetical protein
MIIKKCGNCDFYDSFTGACCNGLSDNHSDFMNEDDSCINWWRKDVVVDNVGEQIYKEFLKYEKEFDKRMKHDLESIRRMIK